MSPKSRSFDRSKKPFVHQSKRGATKPPVRYSHLIPAEPLASVRLQKYLAEQGQGSRRAIEQWIREGRITVNGQIASLGCQVTPHDQIGIDGVVIRGKSVAAQAWPLRVLVYHKPEGLICTRSDPQGRPTVFADLPGLQYGRWIQVGRLDVNTAGLIVFTNWGELAHRLMHPRYQVEREYAVRVLGDVSPEQIQAMQKGVSIGPGNLVRFQHIVFEGGDGANKWYKVIITEGQNREVRRIWETQGITVSRLLRIRYGSVVLPRLLPRGQCEELDPEGKTALLAQVGLALKGGVIR